MKIRKLKIWLSATDLSAQDFGQIISILPKFEIVYNQQLIREAGASFNLGKHLAKIKECDLFLGLINPKMSESVATKENIPLREIGKAIDLGIPYWYAVHRDVTFTRNLLNDLVLKSGEVQSSNKNVFDIRTIDIYNEILMQRRESGQLKQITDFFRLSTFLGQINNSVVNANPRKKARKMMLASTVYGFEDQLSKIISDLELQDFWVLNSFYGSIKVNPNLSNLDNCVQSVVDSDWFVGIVRPYYGTGNIKDKDAVNVEDKNITFEEIRKAIELDKPRWFYVHRDVDFCSKIFKKIEVNVTFDEKKAGKVKNKNKLKSNVYIDARTIDLYNFVIKDHETNVALRNGNWAQEFFIMSEAQRYFQTQLSDQDFIKSILKDT